MATYGAIPTAPPGSGLDYISQATDRPRSAMATRRPWKEMLQLQAFGIPPNFQDAMLRIRSNIAYFCTNYTIIVLIIIFLSLLWHPISLIVFLIMMAAWLFFYFSRDDPLVIFHRTIDDRIVLAVLGIVTIVVLLLTHVTLNVVVSVLIGAVIVTVHAAFTKTEDLYVDEEAASGKRLLSNPSASSS